LEELGASWMTRFSQPAPWLAGVVLVGTPLHMQQHQINSFSLASGHLV